MLDDGFNDDGVCVGSPLPYVKWVPSDDTIDSYQFGEQGSRYPLGFTGSQIAEMYFCVKKYKIVHPDGTAYASVEQLFNDGGMTRSAFNPDPNPYHAAQGSLAYPIDYSLYDDDYSETADIDPIVFSLLMMSGARVYSDDKSPAGLFYPQLTFSGFTSDFNTVASVWDPDFPPSNVVGDFIFLDHEARELRSNGSGYGDVTVTIDERW